MAQADSVPSSSRQLITGESANQSTNLRAVNLPAVIKPGERRSIHASRARIIIASDEAPHLGLWREKRGDEPEGLLKCSWYWANAGQAPVGSNIGALYYANAFFLRRLLWRFVLILLPFVSRNKRSRNSALDKASTNQLVPSKPQGRLP